MRTCAAASQDAQYRGIVFVQQIALTFPLAHLLTRELQQVGLSEIETGAEEAGEAAPAVAAPAAGGPPRRRPPPGRTEPARAQGSLARAARGFTQLSGSTAR